MAELVIEFDRIDESHRTQVGSKGYTLAALRRAGFAVPAGFVITVEAYCEYMRANGLDELLSSDVAEEARVEFAKRSATTFEKLRLPSELEAAIDRAYCELGVDQVAVRSSATSEDGHTASFAGQFETYLDIADRDALHQAVRRCWDSLWSERALAYRDRMQQTGDVVAMSVIVQRKVDAAQAGVAFTLDPLTGRRDVTVIEAVSGMGAALMDGQVAPRRYVIEERGDTKHIGDEMFSDQQLGQLLSLARAIEAWAQRPQDIEWAFDRSAQLHVLQARPVTAISQESGTCWTRDNVGEVVPEPITPLSWSILEPLTNDTFICALRRLGIDDISDNLFGRFYGYVYLNLTLFQQVASKFYLSHAGLRGMPGLLRRVLNLFALRLGLMCEAERLITSVRSEHAPQVAVESQALLAQLDVWRAREFEVMTAHHLVSVIGTILTQLLEKVAGDTPISELLALPAHVRSAASGEQLNRMALKVAANETLREQASGLTAQGWMVVFETTEAGRALLAELDEYLSEYGHGAPQEFELASPRWRDDPVLVVAALQARLRTIGIQAPHTEVNSASKISLHPRTMLIKETLRFIALRENLKDAFVLAHGNLRRLYLALGKTMVDSGALTEHESIFFLTHAEISSWVGAPRRSQELQECAAAREHELHATRRSIPFELEQLADGRLIQHDRVSNRGSNQEVLFGVPVSPGTFVGRARVAHSPSDAAALEPGEVLVVPAVTPGWAPLLRAAGALVTEIGSLLSHGAVITREYGLPAVLNVPRATELIHTGRRVLVDGTRGRVHLLEES